VLLRRSARLRVLARDLRFTGFLRVRRHVAGWWGSFIRSAGGDAGESAQGEGREALLRESGAAEGHSGGGGEEEVGCWGGHCGLWDLGWCWCSGRQEKGKLYYHLVLISHATVMLRSSVIAIFDPGYARVSERAKLRSLCDLIMAYVIGDW
jgi:hypothetical protein